MQSDPTASAEGTAPEESLGLFGRLNGIYFSPSETFPAIGRRPRSILPMILVAILVGLSSFMITNRYGYENTVRKQMQAMVDAGWMPQEVADQQIRASTTGTAATIGKIQGPIGGGIVIIICILALAGIFKLVTLIVGAESGFKALLGVTSWTFLATSIPSTILLGISLYLTAPEEVDMLNPLPSNLGAWLAAVGAGVPKFLSLLLSYVDVFGIWKIALLAIGYAAVSRKLKTSTAAVFLVVLYVMVALLMSAVASIFT